MRRVAILGGGLGSLATAWELSSYPGWDREFELTVYAQGWRLGGKMATGRSPEGRVEEVGLHLLLGWYDNAFPMFRDAWDERTRRGLAPQSPHRRLDDVLVPNNGTLLIEDIDGTKVNWPLIFPPNDGRPGRGEPVSTWELLQRGAAIVASAWLGSPNADDLGVVPSILLKRLFDLGAPSARLQRLLDRLPAADLSALSERGTEGALRLLEGGTALLGVAERWSDDLDQDEGRRRLFILTDFAVALLRGLLDDVYDPTDGRFHYRRINHLDFREWLRGHGARERTLASPLARFFYTGTFEQLVDGNDQGGRLAAGTALQFFLPALAYRGSFCFQLALGTADTLVAPLYQVLAARGVKFRFFSRVVDVVPEGEDIGRVVIEREAEVGDDYDPLVTVAGNPCWPNAPRWEQVRGGGWCESRPRLTLRRGVDFDDVVLAIPPAAHPQAAPSVLRARPDWKLMSENIGTAIVLSAQLWFEDDLAALGYHHRKWGMSERHGLPNVVTAPNPLFSWLDQTPIIASEGWGGSRPRLLAMFTGVLPPHLDPLRSGVAPPVEAADAVARALCWQWLMDHMGFFLPGARTSAYPTGLDLNRLWPFGGAKSGPERFHSQFFRLNLDPTDRYVVAVPGTEPLRLRPDGSGFNNLLLAGDWTDYGVNIGYMEGVVVSAHQAVRAIRERAGHFDHRPLVLDPDVADRL